ncbi:DUF4168 domain-containing protein [Alloalcanivorax gelatiniphagus]|uniref:DUF4168 domain-containing protein n=1 Tax=Alloalcanivorax gelatiniphagus TaxID=1194167 RepID=A0ABY2XMY9_9GAMM|nr:DUF4168 domain-containing protein [Alloalcanivorax gelatiniphagus]TMW12776.1 DUF4168 domain-containing protein [Alloalcanivorax gelatiniphagus]
MKKPALSLSALLLAAGLSGTVAAQQPPQSQQQGATGQPPTAETPRPAQPALGESSDISDDEVARFADAQQKVEEIKGQYRVKVQENTEQPQQAMEVQREAQQKMVQAVKDTGLEVRKYNQIAQLAQYDAGLRERIEKHR